MIIQDFFSLKAFHLNMIAKLFRYFKRNGIPKQIGINQLYISLDCKSSIVNCTNLLPQYALHWNLDFSVSGILHTYNFDYTDSGICSLGQNCYWSVVSSKNRSDSSCRRLIIIFSEFNSILSRDRKINWITSILSFI